VTDDVTSLAAQCERLRAELAAERNQHALARVALAARERERDQARAELADVTRERDALQRHYDAAAPEHNLLALLDLYWEREEDATAERDQARAELAAAQTDAAEWAREAASLRAQLARLMMSDRLWSAALAVSREARDQLRSQLELARTWGAEVCRERDALEHALATLEVATGYTVVVGRDVVVGWQR
jgi:chromosome segregation ATPase